jgi:hypothetical protein
MVHACWLGGSVGVVVRGAAAGGRLCLPCRTCASPLPPPHHMPLSGTEHPRTHPSESHAGQLHDCTPPSPVPFIPAAARCLCGQPGRTTGTWPPKCWRFDGGAACPQLQPPPVEEPVRLLHPLLELQGEAVVVVGRALRAGVVVQGQRQRRQRRQGLRPGSGLPPWSPTQTSCGFCGLGGGIPWQPVRSC